MKDNDEINDNLRYATLRNESIYDGFANASNAAAHRSIFSITPSKSTLATAPIVSIALVASLAILAHVPDACASIARASRAKNAARDFACDTTYACPSDGSCANRAITASHCAPSTTTCSGVAARASSRGARGGRASDIASSTEDSRTNRIRTRRRVARVLVAASAARMSTRRATSALARALDRARAADAGARGARGNGNPPTLTVIARRASSTTASTTASTGANDDGDRFDDVTDALALTELMRAVRARGHLTAALDPLGRSLGPIVRGYETMEATTPKDARDIHALLQGYPDHFYKEDCKTKVSLGEYLGLSESARRAPEKRFHLGEDAATLDPSGARAKTAWRVDELFERLRDVYCGTMSVECNHLTSKERKRWLREQVECGPREASATERRRTLERLLTADRLEVFLAEKFPSAKRFGLEGAESLVPGLQAFVERSAERDVGCVVLGMAHRGRLNVLHNVFGKPLGAICAEIVDDRSSFLVGDVRYHLGARVVVDVDVERGAKQVALTLVPNPSHLEMVNAVVSGVVRAKQFKRDSQTEGASARAHVLPLLLHGDASFCGLGQNGEVMQLQDLPDYTTGGTVHVVVNNQIGFTTVPRRARSSPHPSDVAKAYGAPIIHVNGDDPDAVVSAMRLAADYRAEFQSDVVVNYVCYRRFGHNELDDPSITLPLMSRRIEATPRVAENYANACVAGGILSKDELDDLRRGMEKEFAAEGATHQDFIRTTESWLASTRAVSTGVSGREARVTAAGTGMPIDALQKICHSITTPPEDTDFMLHPHVKAMFEARRRAMEPDAQVGAGQIDWATAEALAFASLLMHPCEKRWENHVPWWTGEGEDPPIGSHAHVRLSGQDCVRGTFNQRHAAVYCNRTSHEHVPLDNMNMGPQDKFTAANSPLSEHAVLGFEYGFASEMGKEALVLWEAQFGDFANNAQVIIDQYICSGEERWGQRSDIVLLLPHGYEGQGPDHSTARPERWLAAANDDSDSLPGNAAADLAFAQRTFDALGPDKNDFVELENIRSILTRNDAESKSKMDTFAQGQDANGADAAESGMWDDVEAYFGSSGKVHRRDWIRYMRRRARASVMAQANFVMVQPSTPAQYFHALRRQISSPHSKPLVVLTPKTLLHHKHCASKLMDFAPKSSFRRVIADGDAGDDVTRHENIPLKPNGEIKRVILCTGKIYYSLARQRAAKKIDDVAIIRLEQLFPFPHDALARRLQRYPNAHLVWAQEEPKNMGYWSFVAPRIATTERATRVRASVDEENRRVRFVGRPPSAAPATGSLAIHNAENARLIAQALNARDDDDAIA